MFELKQSMHLLPRFSLAMPSGSPLQIFAVWPSRAHDLHLNSKGLASIGHIAHSILMRFHDFIIWNPASVSNRIASWVSSSCLYGISLTSCSSLPREPRAFLSLSSFTVSGTRCTRIS